MIRENTIGNEESKKELFEKQEVRVSYSDELENILRKAALEQRKSLVEDILFGEVSHQLFDPTFDSVNYS